MKTRRIRPPRVGRLCEASTWSRSLRLCSESWRPASSIGRKFAYSTLTKLRYGGRKSAKNAIAASEKSRRTRRILLCDAWPEEIPLRTFVAGRYDTFLCTADRLRVCELRNFIASREKAKGGSWKYRMVPNSSCRQ